jgi:hypothetical protein
VILGSGFHRQALGGNSVLSNWAILLSRLTHSKNLTGNYILDFEDSVIQQCRTQIFENEKPAAKFEKSEKAKLVNCIKKEQQCALSETNRFKYPNIFHSGRISDVVSLNFDTVPETICHPERKKSFKRNESALKKLKKDGELGESFLTQITSYEEFELPSNETIRFWHPHGSIDNTNHIVLGIAKYAELASSTLRIRKYYKAKEDKSTNSETKDLTWFSQIYSNPVLILGASMSHMEWAMWTTFVHRRRNFAKPNNKKHEHPVFQMMSPDESLNKEKHGWFQPLFIDMNFEDQWKELECKHFKKKGL